LDATEPDFDFAEQTPTEIIEAHQNSNHHLRSLVPPEIEAKLVLPSHALHAATLTFTHPRTKMEVTFESPMPAEFEGLFIPQ